MKQLTQVELQQNGYEILNAQITDADLSMADHGSLVLWLQLNGNGWGVGYGGYGIGKGYVGASEFKGFTKGTELIMRVMDTVGVSSFKNLIGTYVRVAVNFSDDGGRVYIIGNIIEDKWFDIKDFFTVEEPKTELNSAEPETTEEPSETDSVDETPAETHEK